MIALLRVDNRLIHGQILETWIPHLKAQAVVVGDDEASKSPLAKAAMTLALPPDVRVTIAPIAEVGWQALSASPERTLVLVREVADARRAWQSGLAPALVARINLGNVHYAGDRRPVTPSLFLSAAELDIVRELCRAGFAVEARAVPSDDPAGIQEIERRYNAAAKR